MFIRKAKERDASAILELELACFNVSNDMRSIKHHIISPSITCKVAVIDELVVGAISIFYRNNSKRAYIASVSVHKDYRRRGIGTKLMAAAERDIRKNGCDTITLYVMDYNKIAEHLYQKLGFKRIRYAKDVFEDAPAWFMERKLVTRRH